MNDNSFFSIDRLVEFGLSLAVAQQMVSTMNNAIGHMVIPGAMNPTSSSSPQMYYAMIGNRQIGPLSEQETTTLIAEKKISRETYMWKPGLTDWTIAESIPDILKLVALTPPPFSKD